jgi:hypothetical protein
MRRAAALAAAAILAACGARADTFTGTLRVSPEWRHTSAGVTDRAESFSDMLAWSHTNGVAAGAMDVIATRSLTLTNGQSVTVSPAALTNGFGVAVTVAKVRVLAAKRTDTQAGDVSIVASVLDSEVFRVTLPAGGFSLLVAPTLAGAGAPDFIVTNSGTNTIGVTMWIGGASQ